ncbi:MAG: TIGR00266 family protein [Thermoplasmatales archaeon]|nr:TIGR00266 family protein [Thermoplasmatales archaeon]
MRYTITGDNLQFVNIQLSDGETFLATPGNMKYMSGNMRMEAKMEGGLLKGLKRSLSGESFFMVRFTPQGGTGLLGLGGDAPGKIMDIDVTDGAWLVQRAGFIGSETTVKLDLAFQKKLGNIFFGGEGLILQKVSGQGVAFISACGDFNVIDLKPGEQFKIATGNAVAWEEGVKFDITATGGFKTALFGGEGLFVTTLTGPGKIVIQSMTLANLATALIPYLPTQG